MLRHPAPITVNLHHTPVTAASLQIIDIIAHRKHYLVGHQRLAHQLQRQRIRHLAQHQKCLRRFIRTMQHLPRAQAADLRPVALHIGNRTRLPTPGVVNQKLRIFSEKTVQQLFIIYRTARYISHSIYASGLQLARVATADAPEIRQRPMLPQLTPVALLVQLRNPHAVGIRRNMLGPHIHRHLRQKQISADACSSGNTRFAQNIQNNPHRQLPRRQAVKLKILRYIHKHLVHRIDDDILRCHITQINFVNPRAVFHIIGHPRRRNNKIQCQLRLGLQLRIRARRTAKLPAGSSKTPCGIYLLHTLLHLKQAPAPRNTVAFQRRRHRQTDGFIRPPLIRHHQISIQRIKSALTTFYRRIKRF